MFLRFILAASIGAVGVSHAQVVQRVAEPYHKPTNFLPLAKPAQAAPALSAPITQGQPEQLQQVAHVQVSAPIATAPESASAAAPASIQLQQPAPVQGHQFSLPTLPNLQTPAPDYQAPAATVAMQKRTWIASAADGSLRSVLNNWVRQVGWDLVWNSHEDLAVEVDAEFHGDLEDVTNQILDAFPGAQVDFVAVLWHGNKVLTINETGKRLN